MWQLELDGLLSTTALNQSGPAVVHRVSYHELDVASANPVSVHGSCANWRTQLSGDLEVSSLLYKPAQLYFTVQTALDAVPTSVQCSDAQQVNAIVSALGNSTAAAQVFVCGAHSWVVRRCSSLHVPSVCVDCADPCDASAHCNNAQPYTVAPCVTPVCTETSSLASAIRQLVVLYEDHVPAPIVLSRSTQSTQTSLVVSTTLSAPGTMYCAAYILEPMVGTVPAPTSASNILLQNHVGSTSADSNVTVVHIEGLLSATDFLVYCITMSPTGALLCIYI